MSLSYAEIDITQAQCVGNVELKSAVGTLPQRLAIEKIWKVSITEQGWNTSPVGEIKIIPDQNFAIFSVGEGSTVGRYTLIDLTDMSIDMMTNAVDLLYMVHRGINADYVYYMESPYGTLARLKRSDYTKISVATPETAYNQRGCLCSDNYIYLLMRGGIIKKYDLSLNYLEDLLPTGRTDYWGQFVSLDGNEFIFLNHASPKVQKWIRSTDTLTEFISVSCDLSAGGFFNRAQDYYSFLNAYINGEKRYAIVNHHGLLEFDSNGNNKKVILFPEKIGQYFVNPIVPFGSGINVKAYDYDARWLVFAQGSRSTNRLVICAINMKDNDFGSSYAELTKTLAAGSVLKKLIVQGGYAKGYGDSYAEARQIEVKYWNGSAWIEYDTDTLPDINLTTAEAKVRIGLKDRFLGNDRFPYVSKLAILYEPPEGLPDVGNRIYETIDITQPLEVIEL